MQNRARNVQARTRYVYNYLTNVQSREQMCELVWKKYLELLTKTQRTIVLMCVRFVDDTMVKLRVIS